MDLNALIFQFLEYAITRQIFFKYVLHLDFLPPVMASFVKKTECSKTFEKMIIVSLKLEFRKSKRGFITGRGESVYQKS